MTNKQGLRWRKKAQKQWHEMQADDADLYPDGRGEWYIDAPKDCTTFGDWICYLQIIKDIVGDEVYFKPNDPHYLVADWPRPDEQDFMEMKQDAREEINR